MQQFDFEIYQSIRLTIHISNYLLRESTKVDIYSEIDKTTLHTHTMHI